MILFTGQLYWQLRGGNLSFDCNIGNVFAIWGNVVDRGATVMHLGWMRLLLRVAFPTLMQQSLKTARGAGEVGQGNQTASASASGVHGVTMVDNYEWWEIMGNHGKSILKNTVNTCKCVEIGGLSWWSWEGHGIMGPGFYMHMDYAA